MPIPCAMRYSSNLHTSLTGFGPRAASSVGLTDKARAFRCERGTSRMGVGKAARSGRGSETIEARNVA